MSSPAPNKPTSNGIALATPAESTPGGGFEPLEQLGDELLPRLRGLVNETGRRDARRDELLRAKPRIDDREVQQATNQQRCRHDEHDGKGELDSGQPVRKPALAGVDGRRARTARDERRTRARRAQRRQQPEYEPRRERRAEGEREHAHIDTDLG